MKIFYKSLFSLNDSFVEKDVSRDFKHVIFIKISDFFYEMVNQRVKRFLTV